MSDVVLRCPHCGTTQAAPGECETCHEAEVRWYCPNHTPGRWVDGPTCAECETREARERVDRDRLERERAARERLEETRRERGREARERAARERSTREAPPTYEEPRATDAPTTREELARRELERILRGALGGRRGFPIPPLGRSRGRATPPTEGDDSWLASPPPVSIGVPALFGCLGRLVMWAVVAIVILGIGTCFLMGPGIQIGSGEEGAARPVVAAPPPRPPDRMDVLSLR